VFADAPADVKQPPKKKVGFVGKPVGSGNEKKTLTALV